MRKFAFIVILIFFVVTTVIAQRRITPVERKAQITVAPQGKDKKKHQKDSIKMDSAYSDSTKMAMDTTSKKMIYPLMHSVIVGVNIWDPVMRILGQSYGGGDVSAELSIHNRYFPTIEVGIGSANNTPEDGNFTYKGKMAIYGKIGASYNFFYNKTPDYQLLGGFRLGFSSFKYDITNISANSGYWNENTKFEILNQKSHALWGEIVLGIKVKVVQNFSVGWALRYRFIFNYKKNINSDPWYIPGFGNRSTPIGASLSLYYTLPLPSKKKVDHTPLKTAPLKK
ncbi:MAG: DUF6048 family protein [Muribaculaceae bacterium]